MHPVSTALSHLCYESLFRGQVAHLLRRSYSDEEKLINQTQQCHQRVKQLLWLWPILFLINKYVNDSKYNHSSLVSYSHSRGGGGKEASLVREVFILQITASTDCAYSCVLSDKHKYSGVLRPQQESHTLETRFKSSRHVRCVLHGDNVCFQARCIFI